MKVTVAKATVDASFVLLLIATYPINYPLFASMRLVDVVLMLFVGWGLLNNHVRLTGVNFLATVFAVLVFLSTLYGTVFIGIKQPENVVFLYKYGILFVCIWLIVSSRLTERQIRCALKALLLSFVAVLVHIFLSLQHMLITQPELILKFRPNFPFTPPFGEQGGYLGDAHLLAAYLSTGLLAVFFSQQSGVLCLRPLSFYVLLCTAVTAMVLTGSRNGIVTSTVVLCWFFLACIRNRLCRIGGLWRIQRRTLRTCSVILLFAGTALVFSAMYGDSIGRLDRLLKRATSLEFRADRSAMGRLTKLAAAADLVLDGPVLIGVGMQSSPRRFYDGAVSAVLVSSGGMGLCVYAGIIYFFFSGLRKVAMRNQREAEYFILLFVSANYLLANLITEFFLVSRSVVPFCVFLGLMTRWIHISGHDTCNDMVV